MDIQETAYSSETKNCDKIMSAFSSRLLRHRFDLSNVLRRLGTTKHATAQLPTTRRGQAPSLNSVDRARHCDLRRLIRLVWSQNIPR